MPIKTINDLIMQGIKPERVHSLHKERPKINPKYTEMGDVVPPLGRGEFLHAWKCDRKELVRVKEEKEKIIEENKKLKKVMQTTWSKDWPREVSKILKEEKNDKKT
jgi:hypothetical protein